MKRRILFTLCVLNLGINTAVYADAPIEDYSTAANTANASNVNTASSSEATANAQRSPSQVWQEWKKEDTAKPAQAHTNVADTSAAVMSGANMTLEQRINRLEKQVNYKNNMQAEMETLQQKIQKISGDLETQQHKMEQLEKQLNDFYTDLDQRVKNKSVATESDVTTGTTEPVSNNKTKAAKVTQKLNPERKDKVVAKPELNSEQKNKVAATKSVKKVVNSDEGREGNAAGDKNGKNNKDNDSAPYTANTVNPSDAPVTSNNSSVTQKELSLKEQQAYQAALDDLRNKQFTAGAQKLKTYLTAYPSGTYSANAHYWLGEIYFLNNSYAKANSEFDTVVTKYPSSSKIPEALFKLAYIHDKQGKRSQAQNEYLSLKKHYPNSSVAKLADQQLQQMAM